MFCCPQVLEALLNGCELDIGVLVRLVASSRCMASSVASTGVGTLVVAVATLDRV
jgi:hypothetical protein